MIDGEKLFGKILYNKNKVVHCSSFVKEPVVYVLKNEYNAA